MAAHSCRFRPAPPASGVVHVVGRGFSETIEDLDVRAEHRTPRSALAILVPSRRAARHAKNDRDRLLAHSRAMAELTATSGTRQALLELRVCDCPLEPVWIFHGYSVTRCYTLSMSDSVAQSRSQPVPWGDDHPYEGVVSQVTWIHQELDDDWAVGFKVLEQEGERAVVEMQLRPRDPENPPRGGISTRLLRRITLGQALAAIGRANSLVGTILPPEVAPLGVGRRRRRRDETLLLLVALRYHEAREKESRQPARDTWEALRDVDGLRYSIGTVRQLIREARRTELLTPTTSTLGKGKLTDKARALLLSG